MTPTILTFPAIKNPADVSWGIETMDGRFVSPLAGTFQDIIRPGSRWLMTASWKVFTNDDQQAYIAWSAQMARGGSRSALPNFAYAKRGSAAGTPLVNGAGQTGFSLNTKGWTASAANVLRAGDMFQVTDGTLHQLVMVTADISADGSGHAAVPITPSLRIKPTDSSALVTTNPTAYFAFSKPSSTAAYTPPRQAAMAMSLIEDIQL